MFCLIQSTTAATGAKPDGRCPGQANENRKDVTPISVILPLTSVVHGPKRLNDKTGGLNSDDKIFNRQNIGSTFLRSICLILDYNRFLGLNRRERERERGGGRGEVI